MKQILINRSPWQNRIAITREGRLQNIYFDTPTDTSLERSFFKGIVTKVLPGIQTAFVDIGQERAGFLHISEIDRELALKRMASGDEEIEEDESTKKIPIKRELDINKILREGEAILVQVSKEPIHEKGAKLTTCFTLPGRFSVLMPNIPRIGISKKIEDPEERQRLRAILRENLPEGMGAIIRTTSENKGKSEIIGDLKYLTNTWNDIQKKFKDTEPEQKVYEDIDPVLQAVRDHLDNDVEQVICDNKEDESRIYRFVKQIATDHAHKIRHFREPIPLFEHYGLEKQIEQALNRKVFLKSGGSIIIESTEAMTVIDVNTGKYTGKNNLEDTILKTNLEAAGETVRQLRLRNIGGLIVIDFIDMNNRDNRQKLYNFFEKTLRERDKFQSVVLRLSEFGLVQMTRKRSGKTLIQELTNLCPTCRGNGFIKSIQTETFDILRSVKEMLERKALSGDITLQVHPRVADYLIETEYNAILLLEKNYYCKVTVAHHQQDNFHEFSVEPSSQISEK